MTWLHISDIHFLPTKEWRDNHSRTALLNHLAEVFSLNPPLRPDFIFCTGDIAFGEYPKTSLPEQYAQAVEFFDALLAICGDAGMPLPKERLFIVPGNHDVARSKINSDIQTALTLFARESDAHAETINQRFNDCSKEFKETINRLDEYGAFIKQYLPHQYDVNGRHHYSCITNVKGIKIGVAGFNSSWSCAGPEDDRNLWLAANWQFNAAQEALSDADIRIGLIHHPLDWLNPSDRDIANRRLASDYDFWLHGHSHNAWVTPVQSHIVLAAGAIGAENSDEFGVNLTSIDLSALRGVAHLHTKRSGSNGWTIAPIENHAPTGLWQFDLPIMLRKRLEGILPAGNNEHTGDTSRFARSDADFIDRALTHRLETALLCLPSQPTVWISPIVCKVSEIAKDAKTEPRVDLADFVKKPQSVIIKAPPQYGLTCLAHFLVREAWRSSENAFWLYLSASELQPNTASIDDATLSALTVLGLEEKAIKCVVLDSWSCTHKRALLAEIMGCWEQASKILLIVLPTLAARGRAVYDGAGFFLSSDFGDTPQERFIEILTVIPSNVVSWCRDDLYSRKMGPLLIDQLANKSLERIAKHELILLLIQQRPRNWGKHVHAYIVDNAKASYYLYDVYRHLRHEYQYGFVSPHGLKEIENLIKVTAAKHVTGKKAPGIETVKKVRFADDVIPPRMN